MPRFKVTSGDFEVIVEEKNYRKAGDLAIMLHFKSNHPTHLGVLTLVQKLNKKSEVTGNHNFISTQHLINDNTSGLGESYGQYSKVNEN